MKKTKPKKRRTSFREDLEAARQQLDLAERMVNWKESSIDAFYESQIQAWENYCRGAP